MRNPGPRHLRPITLDGEAMDHHRFAIRRAFGAGNKWLLVAPPNDPISCFVGRPHLKCSAVHEAGKWHDEIFRHGLAGGSKCDAEYNRR